MSDEPQKKAARKATKKVARKRVGKAKGGRPTQFKEEYCELAKNYCLLGAIDSDLAKFFGVSEQTINSWKEKHPKFLESLKEGKDEADAMVAQRLFQRAIGYSHTDTKFATYEGKITDAKEYIKHYAPDVTACIFWLKNRRPDLWRDRQELETTTKAEMVISDETQEKIVNAVQHAVDVEPPASFNGEARE